MKCITYTKCINIAKDIAIFCDKKRVFRQKSKNNKMKNLNILVYFYQSRELNLGPIAPKANAFPLHNRVN